MTAGSNGADDQARNAGRPPVRLLQIGRAALIGAWLILITVDVQQTLHSGTHIPHYGTLLAVLLVASVGWIGARVLDGQAELRGRVDMSIAGQADLRRRMSWLRAYLEDGPTQPLPTPRAVGTVHSSVTAIGGLSPEMVEASQRVALKIIRGQDAS